MGQGDPETGVETLRSLAEEEDLPESVTIGDVEMDSREFVDRLDAVASVADSLDVLANNLQALRSTGLRDSDAVNLMYGRNSSLTKGTIRSVVDGIDSVEDGIEQTDREELLVTLVSDASGVSKTDTREVFDELDRLNSLYGDNDD